MSPRAAPLMPMRRRTPLARVAAALGSEWTLATLALILAILVWAVVRREITDESDLIEVELDLQTSSRFEAFYQDRVFLTLRGPRGEVESARQALGSSPPLKVRISDLPEGEDHRQVEITREMVAFPFPPRLLSGVRFPRANVYRVMPQRVAFDPPALTGIEKGIGYDIVLDPPEALIRGPAGRMGQRITPDPIDVSAYFPEDAGEFLPEEARKVCSFNEWRARPGEEPYRADVELPAVTAIVRFHAVAQMKLKNRIRYVGAEGYEISPAQNQDPEVVQGWFEGTFEGSQQDLERLKAAIEADLWWFVVRIPKEKLPAEGEKKSDAFPIDFVHASSLDGLRVRFVTAETIFVDIKPKDS